jgi:hypothetical protein
MSAERLDEALLGWRVWRIANGRLHAVVWGDEWPPQVRLDARCEDAPSPFWEPGASAAAHPAPHWGCECGVYAFKHRKDAEHLAREKVGRDTLALGRVSLWGRVIESERGYRAAYAYPYDLELLGGTEQLARALRQTYAVDVSLAPAVAQLHAGRG